MLSAYPACFFQEETGYSVVFPDLQSLSTCGTDLNDALYRATDCLAGYLYTCRTDKTPVPLPSDICAVSPEQVAAELGLPSGRAFVSLVSVDVEEYARLHFTKSVRKSLSIPSWLNDRAVQAGMNLSEVLQEALIERLGV